MPGSTRVWNRDTNRLENCNPTLCPHAINGVNHAPFGAFGGWSGYINKNADPVNIMNTVKESLARKVEIGGITQDRAMFDLDVATDKLILGRGSLYAKDLAREQVKNGRPPSSPDEVRRSLNKIMGFELNDSQAKTLDETLTDTYYKELATANTQNDAEEKMAWHLEEEKFLELLNWTNLYFQ